MHLQVQPLPPSTPTAAGPGPARGGAVFAVLFAAVLGLGLAFRGREAGGFAAVLAALGVWALGAALAAWVAAKTARWARWVRPVLEAGTFFAAGWVLWSGGRGLWPASPPADSLRLFAVLLLVLALALRFAALYAESLQRALLTGVTDPGSRAALAPLARFFFLYGLLGAVALFVRISTGFDAVRGVALAGGAALALFALEALARAALRFYQPRALREADTILHSGLLAVLLRGGNPAAALAESLERQLGVRLGEVWALTFVRERLPGVALITALLVWAGTLFTAIPTGAHGVRVRLGHFVAPALEPGLHLGWPWPFERVEVVATGTVREFSLGFERDIGGAILWAEKHFEGEKNLLVGTGEELLTVNVPIYYRIADPVAYLRQTADATTALGHLAERHLLALTAAHESFRLMTTDRDETAAQLRTRLQAEADALRLGLEIVFVGLKDIHPPVAVAAAYQDVISAEEEKEAHIYIGRQYAATQLPLAQEEAHRLRTAARAAATARLAAATGEAARFASLEAAHRAAPALYRLRLKYETLEETLPHPQKLVIDRSLSGGQAVTLDLRRLDGGYFLDAAPVPPAAKP